MIAQREVLERRLRWAAVLVTIGLLVQAGSFTVRVPPAFVAFLVPGALLVVVGVALYLWSIASLHGG